MCNLSEYIEEKGKEKGKQEQVIKMYLEGDISYELALKQLGDKELLDKLIASQKVRV